MTRIHRICYCLLAAALCLSNVATAQAQGQGGGRPKATFDEELTPLQAGIREAVEERKNKGKEFPALTLRCANPNSNNPKCDPLPPEEQCQDCGDMVNAAGKIIGRRNRTETIIDYAGPRQQLDDSDRFDRIKMSFVQSDGFGTSPGGSWRGIKAGSEDEDESGNKIPRPDLSGISDRDLAAAMGGQNGESNALEARLRRNRMGLVEPSNDDLDCIDGVTLEWAQGDGCFLDGKLRINLTELVEEDADGNLYGYGCRHDATGEEFIESPDDGNEGVCYDEGGGFKATSLEELIDEDGPEDLPGQQDPIDQDGDGYFDEDPSESDDIVSECERFYASEGLNFDEGTDIVDDECDVSRAFMVRANREVLDHPLNSDGDLAYLVDEQGYPVDDETAKQAKYRRAKAYGEHPRQVRIKEDYAFKCRGNEELVDGECVGRLSDNPPVAAAIADALADRAEGVTRSYSKDMLMGFTYAPPVVEWGYQVGETACVDLLFDTVCFEVFFARIGYEFNFAAGLRLPIEVQFTEVPDDQAPGALAESRPVMTTFVQPVNFKVGDFHRVCHANQLSSDCDRFTFPEFFDSFNPFTSGHSKDGSEMVLREAIFAGVQVRVMGLSVISWGVDSNLDLMAMCTLWNLKKGATSEKDLFTTLAAFGAGLSQAATAELLGKIKNQNCGSFVTPFGYDGERNVQRTFPIPLFYTVRASCEDALVRGEVMTIGGRVRPICTGVYLSAKGASLGIGLKVQARLGSNEIDADWWAEGDGKAMYPPGSGSKLVFRHELLQGDSNANPITVNADNWEAGDFKDHARIKMDNFIYYLNTMYVELFAQLKFGGVLSKVPSLANIKLLELAVTAGDKGAPIPQHAGMKAVETRFFVDNYALRVDGKPADGDPDRVDVDTLLIKPGEEGGYQVRVKNLGSVVGDFDNFRYTLSNQPDQTAPYSFRINPNTDLDCVDASGNHYFGNPYDGVGDDCYTGDGTVRSDRTELIDEDGPGPAGQLAAVRDEDGDGFADEDPPENWQAQFDLTTIDGVSPYQQSTEFRNLAIIPFRHPLTKPGLYPVQILADSVEAKASNLKPIDPVGQARIDARDVIFIKVDAFYDPLIVAQLLAESGKPGVGKGYTVEVTNGANVDDSIEIDTDPIDFNLTGCTLTTLGGDDGCPYRATPTAIQLAWTNGTLPSPTGMLQPLRLVSHPFTVDVPPDWAGMEDTTYQVVFTVTSTEDPEVPPATNQVLIEQTVTATMESMTRYIGLELDELVLVLDQAEGSGTPTAGLKPISVQAVRRTNDRALDSILAGDLNAAARSHAANIRIVEGWVQALDGSGVDLPQDLFEDLSARAAAILEDLNKAEVSLIPSA